MHRLSRMDQFAVQNVSNEKLGKIHTVLVDVPAGRVAHARSWIPANRISEKQELIPIPPMALTKGSEKRLLVLDANQLNGAPKIERQRLTRQVPICNSWASWNSSTCLRLLRQETWFEETLSLTGAERGRPESGN